MQGGGGGSNTLSCFMLQKPGKAPAVWASLPRVRLYLTINKNWLLKLTSVIDIAPLKLTLSQSGSIAYCALFRSLNVVFWL